jgi:hypothetical protein
LTTRTLLTASSSTELTSAILRWARSEYLRIFLPMNQMNPNTTGITSTASSVNCQLKTTSDAVSTSNMTQSVTK